MAKGYMPRQDKEAAAWMEQFTRVLLDDAGGYGVPLVKAQAAREVIERFLEAYERATNPQTRTRGAVVTKDQTRREAEAACRPIYMQVKADPAIQASAKIDLGIRPPKPAVGRVGPPAELPHLKAVGQTFYKHVLNVTVGNSNVRTARPDGVAALQLFRRFQDDPHEPPMLVGCYTRWPFEVQCDARDNGRRAVYTARWLTRRGQTSDFGPPLDLYVVAPIDLPTSPNRMAA
jgi:hypothetical protein